MAYGDIKRLTTQGLQLDDTAAAVYTAPAATRVQIGTIILHNSGAAANDVIIYSGGDTAADILLNITLDPNETYEFSPKVPVVLEGAEALEGEATNDDEVNIFAYGREET
jgi:hypothetical protein